MTFGYVGYIWAISLCVLVSMGLAALGGVLVAVGRRAERRGPRSMVEESPLASRGETPAPPPEAR